MNTVLVGAQWGDEGKGKVIDFLTEEADVVVRFQGGSNAGHTVVVGDKKYVLHLVPSGVLHDGKNCVIGNGVVMDPFDLVKEIEQVESWGFELKGRFRISERAQMVMQWHRALDRAEEAVRPDGQKIGTTGRGIGPAYAAKVGRYGMRVGDILRPDFLDLVRAQVEDANIKLKALGAHALDADEMVKLYAPMVQALMPYVTDTRVSTQRSPYCSRAPRRRCSTSTSERILSSRRPTPRQVVHVLEAAFRRAPSTV